MRGQGFVCLLHVRSLEDSTELGHFGRGKAQLAALGQQRDGLLDRAGRDEAHRAPDATGTPRGTGVAHRQTRSSQVWRLYPAKSSSPPSPESATVTARRATAATRWVGNWELSENGSSQISGSRGTRSNTSRWTSQRSCAPVPRWAATAAAEADSSNDCSAKATVKVRTGRAERRCIERDDQARIDAAREQGPDGHLGDHASRHRSGEHGFDGLNGFAIVRQGWQAPRVGDGLPGRPVRPLLGQRAWAGFAGQGDQRTRLQLGEAFVDAGRRRTQLSWRKALTAARSMPG